ncbi:zinc finger MYM-type protein 1-like [Amphiura filiformis]|uniref:zinc finger MYM-type protein 1-like n=1 Tax=Amphiura filiformis TaxID=82378 RepID=UPI003B216CCA
MSSFVSKEKTQCGYCGIKIRRDKLKNHTKLKHRGQPVSEKGWQNIASVFGKKRSVPLQPKDDDNPDTAHHEDTHVSSAESESEEETTEMAAASDSDVHMTDEGSDTDVPIPVPMAENASNPVPTATAIPLINKTLPFPTDPVHFINKPVTPELCHAILAEGPCQPGLNEGFDFAKNEKGRSFVRQWYCPKLKNGMKSYRDWLVYSPAKDRAYCFPCWLFANKSDPAYNPNFADPNEGYKRWRDASTKFVNHENCDLHKQAVKVLIETKLRLKLGKSVNQEQQRARERQVMENRKVLCRLLDATLYLSKQNLAFRGHNESIKAVRQSQETAHSCFGKSSQDGNFLELIKLLAKYDASIAKHLATAPKNASYLSPQIQNEFISSIAQVIQDRIIAEIKQAHYFGVIMDSTIDISHVDQLSFCIRYVDEHFRIQERFLLFTDINKSDSQSLFDRLKEILADLGLEIKLIRSQSYDGAANMSGKLSGLQTRVKEENDLALYVHCCAHNLNLVLCDACSECTEAITFFGTIQKIYNFFTKSQPRHNALEAAQKELSLPAKKLHKQCDTRWYCKQEAVKSIKETYPALLLALENLAESERNAESRADINGLLGFISNIEFLLMLEIWMEILTDIKGLSEYLQKESMDLVTASRTVKSTQKTLKENRTDTHFQELLHKARTTAEEEGVPNEFTTPRIRRRKNMPGERTRDDPVIDPEDRFRINVFYRIYDTLHGELESRFEDYHSVVKRFACLMPSNIGDIEGIKELSAIYESDVDKDLVLSEYKQFTHFFKDSQVFAEKKPQSVQDMLLVIKENDLNNAYPNLTVLYLILGTIAISSATAERSFSRLKLIKSYLRSTMSEERLSSLATISIERDLVDTINFDAVIDMFSTMRQRRIVLH